MKGHNFVSVAEIFKLAPPILVDCSHFEKTLRPIKFPIRKDILTGIEVEIENIRFTPKAFRKETYQVWNTREDGSLRNLGMEFISVPLRGVHLAHALQYLFDNLPEDKHFSLRTSIHVHLDVQSLSKETVTGIVLTYVACETLLYKFVGNDRINSNFCVPMYQTIVVNSLVNLITSSITSIRWENSRYLGLNLDSMRKFGTLEFRHLYGTDDVELITNWINLIHAIHHYGCSKPLKTIIEEISKLNTTSNYSLFLEQVFGPLTDLFDVSNLKDDLERGVRAVKQSTIHNLFYKYIARHVDPHCPAITFNAISSNKSTKKAINWEGEGLDLDINRFVIDLRRDR